MASGLRQQSESTCSVSTAQCPIYGLPPTLTLNDRPVRLDVLGSIQLPFRSGTPRALDESVEERLLKHLTKPVKHLDSLPETVVRFLEQVFLGRTFCGRSYTKQKLQLLVELLPKNLPSTTTASAENSAESPKRLHAEELEKQYTCFTLPGNLGPSIPAAAYPKTFIENLGSECYRVGPELRLSDEAMAAGHAAILRPFAEHWAFESRRARSKNLPDYKACGYGETQPLPGVEVLANGNNEVSFDFTAAKAKWTMSGYIVENVQRFLRNAFTFSRRLISEKPGYD